MHVREVNDRAQWNNALAALPAHHVLQSWEWGQFKSRWGWSPRYLLFESDGHARAAALILSRTLPRIGLRIAYVPKGPALDYVDTATVDAVLSELAADAQRMRTIFIKIDPDVVQPSVVTQQLAQHGWRYSTEQIQFRNTVLLDIDKSEEEILAAMHHKTRYNIRLAARKSVAVRAGSIEDIETLYDMYLDTARRDGFIIRPLDYYRDVWDTFMAAGLAQPLIAEVDGQAIAGLVAFHFGSRAWYMYGMSRDAHRERMPNHLLQWEAMRWAKSMGCTVYDFWGAPDQLDESDPMWGVYRFKAGFNGQFTEHIGAYDFVISRFWYWVYTVAMPRVLDVMRMRGRRSIGM